MTTTFTNPDERGKAFGIYGSIAGAGAAVGLLLGGVLTEFLDWRWTLFVNLIFAGVAIVGTQVLLVRERGVATAGLDIPSTLLISSGLFGIVYGLSHAANDAAGAASSHTTSRSPRPSSTQPRSRASSRASRSSARSSGARHGRASRCCHWA